MEPGRGSVTAERVAERRAAHQVLDVPRVFDDPLALSIILPEAARLLRQEPRPRDRSGLDGYLRSFVSMRSRYAEDALGDAYGRGVRQYAILGAGFDTFAYRNPYPDQRALFFRQDRRSEGVLGGPHRPRVRPAGNRSIL